MKIKLITSLTLAILACIFIVQNVDTVRVDFLVWSVEVSIVLLVFVILGAGVIIGWLMNSYLRFVRNRKHPKQQDRQMTRKKDLPVAAPLHGEKEIHDQEK